MKVKYRIASESEFDKWIMSANMFALSLCPPSIVIKQFNDLTQRSRREIRDMFKEYDNVRRKKLPKDEDSKTFIESVMVDANIIATEYDIDPLTAMLCINPICKDDEIITIR